MTVQSLPLHSLDISCLRVISITASGLVEKPLRDRAQKPSVWLCITILYLENRYVVAITRKQHIAVQSLPLHSFDISCLRVISITASGLVEKPLRDRAPKPSAWLCFIILYLENRYLVAITRKQHIAVQSLPIHSLDISCLRVRSITASGLVEKPLRDRAPKASARLFLPLYTLEIVILSLLRTNK